MSSPPEPDKDDDTSTSPSQQTTSSSLLFSARCESARSIATLLSCLRAVSTTPSTDSQTLTQKNRRNDLSLSHVGESNNRSGTSATSKKSQHAMVFVSPTAITFHVHGLGKQSQASVDMPAGLFSSFHVPHHPLPLSQSSTSTPLTPQTSDTIQGGEFSINLTTILSSLHCLTALSPHNTQLSLSHDRSSSIFKMEFLQEDFSGAVLSTCAIPCWDSPGDDDDVGSLAVRFRESPVVARMICQSEHLRAGILELADVVGATCVTVGMSERGGVEWGVVGSGGGECLVEFPPEGFVSLEVSSKEVTRSYPLHLILQGMRGLEVARETCVSINERGMIAIQHQVVDESVGDGEPNFVDFIMGAILEESDDEEMQVGIGNRYSRREIDENDNDGHDDHDGINDNSHSNHTIVTCHPTPQDRGLNTTSSNTNGDDSSSARPRQRQQSSQPTRATTTPSRRRHIDPSSSSDSDTTNNSDNSMAVQKRDTQSPAQRCGNDNDPSSSPELYFGDTRLDNPHREPRSGSGGRHELKFEDDTDDDDDDEF